MSDRELLELAAKVPGVQELIDDLWATRRAMWSPLTDDGDALRLAVNLGLVVNPGCAHDEKNDLDDPYAATSRAIVRAAAEIGRQMQEGGAA